jgi:hypothetical protein
MGIALSISRTQGTRLTVKCPSCALSMRLVGIEPHSAVPELVDLMTYACVCGKVIAKPALAENAWLH